MGETVRHTHKLDEDQFTAFLAAISAPLADAGAQTPATTPYDLGLEPWTFHDPRQACEVVAYLDPQNQVRHVPTTRASEVPKAWRRMWLQPRA